MEEYVGELWHNFITRRADIRYPKAAVKLSDIKNTLSIQFRAFGGSPSLQLLPATKSTWQARRSFLNRIATRENTVELAWKETDALRLPHEIALFPERENNRKLYLWMVALSAARSGFSGRWLHDNQQAVLETLTVFPGLKSLYDSLVKQHFLCRPDIVKSQTKLIKSEQAVVQALKAPGSIDYEIEYAEKLFPVPLWMHPNPPVEQNPIKVAADQGSEPKSNDKDSKEIEEKQRRKGERVEDPNYEDGLLAFRLESLMSWAEFSPLDRTVDEGDEENAEDIANDLDIIAVTKSKEAPSCKLKFDLDLPSNEYDDRVLKHGILLPEWHYKKNQLLVDRCRLSTMQPANLKNIQIPVHLKKYSKVVRAHFENLALNHQWLRGQQEGSEIDLDRFILHQADIKNGTLLEEPGLYSELRKNIRDLSCLLLADLSLSTDSWVSNDARVIDIIRDSLHIFNDALTGTRDRFAISGFSSKKREHIRYYQLKTFDESDIALTRRRINAISPGYYTRMGAAIRYSTQILEKEASSTRLLLLVSDGKPNDVDTYEGRYGIEDTRHATREALEKGIRVFCVTIDEKANDYLPYIFGCQNYTLIRRASELPLKLPLLYAQLTR